MWSLVNLTHLLTSGQPEREEAEEQELPPVDESSQAPVQTGHACFPSNSPSLAVFFSSLSFSLALFLSSLSYPTTADVPLADPVPPRVSK